MLILVLSLISINFVKTHRIEELPLQIGGVFHNKLDKTSMEQEIFELAITSPTEEEGSDFFTDLELKSIIKNIDQYDSISANIDVCDLLKNSVIAIFGPQTMDTSLVVKSICDAKEIPHIQARYDAHQYRGSCGINLYPHPKALSKAYSDVIKKWEWKSFVIIYEDNESLIRISDLLKAENNGDATVQIYQLYDTNNFRDLFRKIRKSNEYNILLDCSAEILPEVLKQAQQTGLMIENYNYIITCLDLHTLDLEQYKYSGVNITGFRLINPSIPYVAKMFKNQLENYSSEKILVEAALMYDAVNLFRKILRQFKSLQTKNSSINIINYKSNSIPDCDNDYSLKFGFSIINAMKNTEINGLTGLIKFDHEGYRTDVELQVIELTEDGIKEKGIWNTSGGVKIKSFLSNFNESSIQEFRNTTFKVIISMTKPYGMRKRSSNKLEGNDRYEGYAVDLIHELSLLSNFEYELLVQEDGVIGQLIPFPNGTNTWDGMIGAVLNKKADIAIADNTMSKDRATYVEFSLPFMDLGITILFIKPEKEKPNMLSFLFPFSNEVWIYVITAYIGVSLQFFIMARLSPYEWRNPYPCIGEPEELENQFTLSNSFWFTIGALMQQGTDIAPASPSTRMAAGIWWFFTLIMVSSYTANLAACLTVENEVEEFKDAKALANQRKILYGAKKSGTTFNFFRDSNIKEYKIIHDFMAHHPELMTKDNEEGVRKVLESNGRYAFFMESSAIDYEKEQHCELAQIGPLLDNKNYGIAMRKNSWYANTISKDVLVLQEKGILGALKRKWWKEKYSKNCQEDKKNDAQTLKLDDVGGVFLVLIVGVGIAFITMLFELYFNLRNTAKVEKVPLKRELHQELKFIIKCKSVKPARKPDEKSLLGSHSENNNSTSANGNNYNRLNIKNNES